MALATSTIIGIASLAVAAGGAYMSYQQQREAARNQRRAADEQRKINAQTQARQAQDAARERRQQIREERVRRARILQSSENMGVSNSSGQIGAVGALSTNLSSNIGDNLGALQTARTISGHSQRQADFTSAANQNMANANLWGQASSFGSSIFNQVGGFSAFNRGSTVESIGGTQHQGVRWNFSSPI
jgi:hypothetical protein